MVFAPNSATQIEICSAGVLSPTTFHSLSKKLKHGSDLILDQLNHALNNCTLMTRMCLSASVSAKGSACVSDT